MINSLKKYCSLILCAITILTLLSACGGNSSNDNASLDSKSNTSSTTLSDIEQQLQSLALPNDGKALASIQLDWEPVSQRVDESELDSNDISGYTIRVGTTPNNLDQKFFLDDPQATQIIIDGIPSNTYYVAIQTLDLSGLASPFSNIVEITVSADQ